MTDVFPMVVERSKNYASIYFRDAPGILRYRVLAARSLNNAYVGQVASPRNGVVGTDGTEELYIVHGPGGYYRSHGIRTRGLGLLDESYRGQSRAIWDPDEFFDPPTTASIPPDRDLAFLRVQTATVASGNTFGTEGPILIFQSPGFAVVPRPALTVYGNAPILAAAVPGEIPPPESLEFKVPFYGDSLVIINHDAANPLFVSMGRDVPFMQVDPLQSFSHTSGQKDSLILASNAGPPAFSCLISTVQGAR